MKKNGEFFIDITTDVCPMTFVKTRLLIERMIQGDIADIRLSGGEPLENVPDSVTELGHTVLSIEREATESNTDIHRIRIRKN